VRYAPVAPLHLMRQLAEGNWRAMGGYHLLLAQDILRQPNEHEDFWPKWRRDNYAKGREVTIIVDNGAPEGEQVVKPARLAEAARLVHADVVILPDVIGNAGATVESTARASSYFRSEGEFKLMGVAQGATASITLECLVDISKHVDWLSLPKGWSERLRNPRFWTTRQIAQTYRMPMHVLGFTDDLSDDILTARSHPLVKGIDSAMPIWLGQQGRSIASMVRTDYGRRPPFDKLPKQLKGQTLANILVIRQWLSQDLRGVGGQIGSSAVLSRGLPKTAGKSRSTAMSGAELQGLRICEDCGVNWSGFEAHACEGSTSSIRNSDDD